MRMEIGLVQAQVQKQILSPQMIQSMEILVLNAQQLEERIEQALEENVALELEEPEKETPAETTYVDGDASADAPPDPDATTREVDLLEDRYEHLAEFQAEEYYTSPGPRGLPGEDQDDKHEALLNAAGRPVTLQEHLEEQIRLKDLDDRQSVLSREIIYNLDARGYLMYPIEEIHESLNRVPPAGSPQAGPGSEGWSSGNGHDRDLAVTASPAMDGALPATLQISLEELQAALDLVRSLDPPGVGARDLQDCLLLQLDRDPGEYPLERQLIENHMQDIAKNRLPHIAKATGQTLDEVKEAIEIITALNPIPGKAFAGPQNSYIQPDVLIEEVDGEFRVVVANGYLPKVRISPYYRKLLAEARKDPEIRKYIKKKLDNAEWLLHAIHQRRSTLQRVAEEVVAHQQDFFRKGERHLKPLKMQEIADKIGVNVSTVSRAIASKYFQAPGCIKELKHLFTGGTQRDDGSMASRGSVILRIKELIGDEDPKKPLSDSKIVQLLEKEGIRISRRTVTKYREAEGIPSSRERRVF